MGGGRFTTLEEVVEKILKWFDTVRTIDLDNF